jgi:hypothetical protein
MEIFQTIILKQKEQGIKQLIMMMELGRYILKEVGNMRV